MYCIIMQGKQITVLLFVVALVLGAMVGYWYGNKNGDKKGYDRGLTDAAKVQAEVPQVKIDAGYKNPYEGVNLNPFKK